MFTIGTNCGLRISNILSLNVKDACNKTGIDVKIGTHSLRKIFGYRHYKQFKDIAMLQKILIQNKDYYLERRLDMLNKLHLVTNASQNIIDDLNKEFGIINNG